MNRKSIAYGFLFFAISISGYVEYEGVTYVTNFFKGNNLAYDRTRPKWFL